MKRVLITGASSGLGNCLAKEFLHSDCIVWGIGRRNVEELGLNSDIQDGKFYYSICDVSNQDEIKTVYSEMAEKHFLPDIIILNAAIQEDDVGQDFNYQVFRKTFDTNLFGAIKFVELFLPLFLAKKKGVFAAISSLSTYRALNNNKIGYPSSKAALNMAFESFRLQYAAKGVRFIIFNPGRMKEESNSFLTITFSKAAKTIFHHLNSNKSSNIVNFPLVPTSIFKISQYLPDYLISIIRFREV